MLRQTEIALSLEECYRLCGIRDHTAEAEKTKKVQVALPGSPGDKLATAFDGDDETANQTPANVSNDNKHAIVGTTQSEKGDHLASDRSSCHDDLSDCPSDISDWGVEEQVRRLKAFATNLANDDEPLLTVACT